MPVCKQSVAALALLVVMDAEPLDSALEPNLDIEQFDKIDTRLSQYPHRNLPVINGLNPEPHSCFFAERGDLQSEHSNEVNV